MSQIMEAIKKAEETAAGIIANTKATNAGIQASIAAAKDVTNSPEFQENLDVIKKAGEGINAITHQTKQTLTGLQDTLANPPKVEISPEIKSTVDDLHKTLASVT